MRQIQHQARVHAGVSKPTVPEQLKFYGFTTPGLSDVQVLNSIHRLRRYNLPLTVQLEQPAQWWQDVATFEQIYNFAYNEAQKELEAKRNNGRSG